MHLEQGFGPLGAQHHLVKQIKEQTPKDPVERLVISRPGAVKLMSSMEAMANTHLIWLKGSPGIHGVQLISSFSTRRALLSTRKAGGKRPPA